MATITFDTLKYLKELEQAGVPTTQAEAFVNAQKSILSDTIDNTISTKLDLIELDKNIEKRFNQVEADLKLHKWMLGFLIAMQVAMLWKLFVR